MSSPGGRAGWGLRRLILSRPALAGLGLLAGLIVAEVGLRAARLVKRHFLPGRQAAVALADSRLGLRLVPGSGGSDAWGFNNDRLPERAEIVALGDSQTWGYAVRRDQAWPQVLAARSGRLVYSMALGRYGPVQYAGMAGRALKLRPALVIVGLYLGNDLRDAWLVTYCDPSFAALRRPGAPPCDDNSRVLRLVRERDAFLARARARPRARAAEWLAARSEVFGLLARRGLLPVPSLSRWDLAREWARQHPELAASCEKDRIRSILLTEQLRLALDPADPRIAEGLRITLERLDEMDRNLRQAGSRLAVLLIPSRLAVHAELGGCIDPAALPGVERVDAAEAALRREIAAFLAGRGIDHADPLAELRAALAQGEPLYPDGLDGHLNAAGNAILARIAAERFGL